MNITVSISDGGEVEKIYYTGEVSGCPPIPQLNHEISGAVGNGTVVGVKHFHEGDSLHVLLSIKSPDAFVEYTGM